MNACAYDTNQLKAKLESIGLRSRGMIGPSKLERLILTIGVDKFSAWLDKQDALDLTRLAYDYVLWARPKQLPPDFGDFERWLLLSGRGFGKNWSMASFWNWRIEREMSQELVFIGPDWRDVDRNMLGGKRAPGKDGLMLPRPKKSGFFDVQPPWMKSFYNQQKREIRVVVVPTGYEARIYLATGEQKEQRGLNVDGVWLDEPIKMRYLETILENLDMATRGADHECITALSTTPQPTREIKDIVMDDHTCTVQASSRENIENTGAKFIARLDRKYKGTRAGEQEVEGNVLGDAEGALFFQGNLDEHRVSDVPEGGLDRVLVGVDPAKSKHRQSDATGIVAAGCRGSHMYVLGDRTGVYSPGEWADRAIDLAIEVRADGFVVERNGIGDVLMYTLKERVKARGMSIDEFTWEDALSLADKEGRITPMALKATHGEFHVLGRMPETETELTGWEPGKTRSPNRLDALAHCGMVLFDFAQENDDHDRPVTPAEATAMQEINDDWGDHTIGAML